MRRPSDMTDAAWERVKRLPAATRDRVLERATLIYYGGADKTLPEADRMALEQEAGVRLP